MRFKHMGWLRQSLTEAETEKTPLQTHFARQCYVCDGVAWCERAFRLQTGLLTAMIMS